MTEPAAPAESAGRRLPENLRFPGCHPLPLPRDEFDPLLAESDLFAGVSPEAVTAAALACADGNLPLIRSLTVEARVEGYAAGYAEGYTAGYEAGRAAELVAAVRGVFQARGIRLTDSLLAGSNPFAGASRQAVMAAAVTCADEADFRRRLGLPPR